MIISFFFWDIEMNEEDEFNGCKFRKEYTPQQFNDESINYHLQSHGRDKTLFKCSLLFPITMFKGSMFCVNLKFIYFICLFAIYTRHNFFKIKFTVIKAQSSYVYSLSTSTMFLCTGHGLIFVIHILLISKHPWQDVRR